MADVVSLEFLLKKVAEWKASDLFITIGVPPSVKINGKIHAIGDTRLTQETVGIFLDQLMSPEQKEEYLKTQESAFAYQMPGVGRFRVSAFMQRSQKGCVLRRIETQIPSCDDLKLSPVLKDLSLLKKGLILIVGATGCGKSSTMAAMLGHRNQRACGHVLTIEDPVEFLHQHNKCIFTQREVGIDTESYSSALKSALRQAPDVVVIGEIRDTETMQYALNFADTGHLCVSTLHATNAVQALERIAHFYPQDVRDQIWMSLSLNLRAIVGQQLVMHKNGKQRVLVQEVLINTPTIQDAIRRGEPHLLKDFLGRKNEYGMKSFDMSLYELFTKGQINYDEAIAHAESTNNLRLMIKLDKDVEQPSEQQSSSVSPKSQLGILGDGDNFSL